MGFELVFFIQRGMIQLKMAKKVRIEQNLEKIVLSKEDAARYIWDDGKELKIGYHMYDIARQEDKGDSIVYYAAYDDEEVHMMANIEKFFNHKNNTDGKFELQLLKFLTLVTLIPASESAGKSEILISFIHDIKPHFTTIYFPPDPLPPRRA